MVKTLVSLLLLLSNDIEQNPGPINVEKKQEKLEKHVTDLQKDVKSLRKIVETLVSQVDVQNNRERPKMANLLEEVNIVKETTNIQVSTYLLCSQLIFLSDVSFWYNYICSM